MEETRHLENVILVVRENLGQTTAPEALGRDLTCGLADVDPKNRHALNHNLTWLQQGQSVAAADFARWVLHRQSQAMGVLTDLRTHLQGLGSSMGQAEVRATSQLPSTRGRTSLLLLLQQPIGRQSLRQHFVEHLVGNQAGPFLSLTAARQTLRRALPPLRMVLKFTQAELLSSTSQLRSKPTSRVKRQTGRDMQALPPPELQPDHEDQVGVVFQAVPQPDHLLLIAYLPLVQHLARSDRSVATDNEQTSTPPCRATPTLPAPTVKGSTLEEHPRVSPACRRFLQADQAPGLEALSLQ